MLFVLFLAALVVIASGQERRCPSNMIQLFNGVACSTDAMCYNMAPGYFCLNGYCCANSASSPSGYGASCTYQSQCNFANSQCLNNVCYCANGYDFDGYQCRSGSTVPFNPVCAPNEILISNQCYRIANYFDSCVVQQQCDSIQAICRDFKCMCDIGQVFNGYQCYPDPAYQCSCGNNQVLINGRCYSTSLPGGTCQYNQQCTDPHSRKPLYCSGGICRWVYQGNPTCRNPGAAVERINGVVKNCLYQDCSGGYQCEYNNIFNNGQYICCGLYSTTPPIGGGTGPAGQIKFYPGTSLPLECRAINACTFVDYPHCVYSQRYGYQVCCSTRYCY